MYLELLLLLATIAIVAGLVWFQRTPPPVIAARLRRVAIVFGILLLLLLAATGRLNMVVALIGALIAAAIRLLPLIHFVPLLQRLWRQFRPRSAHEPSASAAHRSAVESRFIRMWLDHGSGDIDGEVLEGDLKGQRLSELGRDQLVRLYRDCRAADPESAALLQSYLDRVHGPTWQSASGAAGGAPPGPTAMSDDEAYQVLGLAPGANRNQVVDAHRRLIQKLHPDRGGSDYLAAKINQAKDVLLNQT